MNKPTLTCEATFQSSGKCYTYLTHKHYPPGTAVYAEVGASDIKPVVIHGNHPTTAPLNPNITYRWILGTAEELRELCHVERMRPTPEPSDAPAGM